MTTKSSTESANSLASFKTCFGQLCARFGGVYSEKESYLGGACYHIPTPWGILRASIHGDHQSARRGSVWQSIFLGWRHYTGPADFPLRGDFNRFSHKWNFTMNASSLAAARKAALYELECRLELVRAGLPVESSTAPITLPITDTYAELLAAVNAGDLPTAQHLAQQIAA